jgi:hypothetical protein
MKRVIINCATGEETIVDLTAEEISKLEQENTKSEEERTAIENARTEKENLKASAKAKLVAGEALTEEEANVMIGG